VQENNRRLLQKSKHTHTSRHNAVILKHVEHTVRIVLEVFSSPM